jgi:putative phosphoesterase
MLPQLSRGRIWSLVQIAILADTHLPRGGRRLPDRAVELLEASDLIVHAGDFVQRSVFSDLQTHGEVVGVHGNVDEAELRALLPERAEFRAERATLAVIHDAGPATGRLERLRRLFPAADAVVFGHSHMPLLEGSAAGGFQIFNPGSPTQRRRAPRHTMGIARVEGSSVRFELVDLG